MKKLLIVTYYWPPAGGPGVQRWLKFATYLPQFGISPVVFIPENPTYPILDENLKSDVPKGIKIYREAIFEPYHLAKKIGGGGAEKISTGIIPPREQQTWRQKLALAIRGNFFIPDARKFWVKPAVKRLHEIIKIEEIDTLVTTGPPHSLHLIGLQLQEQLAVKWIADFRDPWTSIGYHKQLKLMPFAKKKHLKLESKVLQNANAIIVTSKSTKAEFATKTKKPIHVITNGFEARKPSGHELDANFSIAHIGSLLSERNPEILWQALNEIIGEHTPFRKKFQLILAGVVSSHSIDSLKKFGLWEYTVNLGYVSHEKALELQAKSQVLLLVEINSEATKMIIPGKLFEYIQTGRPILGLGPSNADFKEIIETTQTGSCFNYTEKEKLKLEILRLFKVYEEGALYVTPKSIEGYSRKNLTGNLASLIKAMK